MLLDLNGENLELKLRRELGFDMLCRLACLNNESALEPAVEAAKTLCCSNDNRDRAGAGLELAWELNWGAGLKLELELRLGFGAVLGLGPKEKLEGSGITELGSISGLVRNNPPPRGLAETDLRSARGFPEPNLGLAKVSRGLTGAFLPGGGALGLEPASPGEGGEDDDELAAALQPPKLAEDRRDTLEGSRKGGGGAR